MIPPAVARTQHRHLREDRHVLDAYRLYAGPYTLLDHAAFHDVLPVCKKRRVSGIRLRVDQCPRSQL